MVYTAKLKLIGYWADDKLPLKWPSVKDFIDPNWNPDDRDFIARYLEEGLVVRTYMGYSKCRICGKNNGDLELSDSHYVWPDGLAHYVKEHAVRLPDEFVAHAYAWTEVLEDAERDENSWQHESPPAKSSPRIEKSTNWNGIVIL
jgi:hypothetical protein